MAGGELFDVYTDQDFWGQAVGWPQRMSGGGWFQDCPCGPWDATGGSAFFTPRTKRGSTWHVWP